MNSKFREWLEGGGVSPFKHNDNGTFNAVMRVPINENFDYLFCQRQYREYEIQRDGKFNFGGIYCKADGLLYDVQYELQKLDADGYARSDEKLREKLTAEVREIILATINNDRRNLKISRLTIKENDSRNDIEYYKKYTAPEVARRLFLQADEDSERELPRCPFECYFKAERWTESSLLEYILAPAEYASKIAVAYIEAHQEDILFTFLSHDALDAEYERMLADTNSNIFTVKKIMRAVKAAGDAKAVTVTIRRGDKEVSFKYAANHLTQDCGNHKYAAWNADASGRRELERLFGRNDDDFYPHEIVKITYGFKTLYEVRV